MKIVLNRIDLIFVRDRQSYNNAVDKLSIKKEKVSLTSDVAVLQEGISYDSAMKLIPATKNDAIVGISTMRWGYFKNRITAYSNYKAYVHEMATLADHILDNHDVRIVFYPTNFPVNDCKDDDPVTARDIVALMKNKSNVRIFEELYTPSQLQGLLACSEINITTRMHACILSTNSCVPTISVNYLFKLREYMESLGLADYSIDIEDFCAEIAMPMFDDMWSKKESIKMKLKKAIAQKKETLWNSMELLDIKPAIKQTN